MATPEQEPCLSVTVARFTVESHIDLTWCVGFTVTCIANGRSTYLDTVVTRAAGQTDDALVQVAWSALRERAEEWCEEVEALPAVLGTTFTA